MRTTTKLQWLESTRLRGLWSKLLRECDVRIYGNRPRDIRVYNDALFARILGMVESLFGDLRSL